MKRLWPCLVAILALSSCTRSKTSVCTGIRASSILRSRDRGRSSCCPDRIRTSIPGPDVLRFTRNGSSYSLQGINPIDQTAEPDIIEQQKADNDQPMSARTLRIGKHLFLMQRDPGGQGTGLIERYDVQRGTLQEYWMDNGAAVEFLEGQTPDGEEHQEKRR